MEIAEEINQLSDTFEKESYFIRLRELTDFDMQPKRSIDKKTSVKEYSQRKQQFLSYPKTGRIRAEQEILSQMLCGVAASNYYKEELGFMKMKHVISLLCILLIIIVIIQKWKLRIF